MGGKVDASINQTRGPRIFRLFGQNYHQIGSLLPPEGSTPKFAQLYIYDTENEVSNRINAVSRGQDANKLHVEIITDLKQMLDDNNVLAKTFRMVRERFQENDCSNVKLKLIGKRGTNGRRYNLPTIPEVATLVVGGDIVLNVESSGIESLLLPGGRIAHSRFAIPLNITKDSTCNIKQGSPLAKLMVKAKFIIWDEAPMMHRYSFEALDQTLRDILRFKDPSNLDRPFGGKTIVFGGDFRQMLLVITKGTRQDIVNATVNSFYLWTHCDGRMGFSMDSTEKVKISEDLLIDNCDDPISGIVESTYFNYLEHSIDMKYLQERAILAPTLQMVESVNDYIVCLNSGQEKSYLSSDIVCMYDHSFTSLGHMHTPEFLNSIKCSGIPNYSITLKVGVPVMLLRNIDQSTGLCNGTRLIITRLKNWVIEAKVLSRKEFGNKVYISRMSLTPSDSRIPLKFQQRQFPMIVFFAMIINKIPGQSLCSMGLFLKKPVFTDGQLYVALS
ncbi:ATP-dependent DNA helicase PIF1-like [Capsicum annuum]|uniref:ATP-dependent DNA helicase PIF1-like n=1 Tax=Capsicum annuum TaxID=4072 RepID=UPI001FB174A9|nr:ATP-dependent DNA helicase PIF1-like [Capsicum annuum]